MNQIIESLFARKSVRAFTEQEIPEEIVQVILQASTQAPGGLLRSTQKNRRVTLRSD